MLCVHGLQCLSYPGRSCYSCDVRADITVAGRMLQTYRNSQNRKLLSAVALSMNQEMHNSIASKIPQKRTNNLEAFSEVRNSAKPIMVYLQCQGSLAQFSKS